MPGPKPKTWEDYPDPVVDTESGCLRWQGPHHPKGYGLLSKQYAHRVAWERENGPIPEGMTIDHVAARGCAWKDCVLVKHLEVVTRGVNSARGSIPTARREKPRCPQDHPYAGDNLIIYRGRRYCRACMYERQRRGRSA